MPPRARYAPVVADEAPYPVVRELPYWRLGRRFLCRRPDGASFCVVSRVDSQLRDGPRREFLEALRKASARRDPSLVRVLETGEDAEGRFWIATEAVLGTTVQEILEDVAARGRRVPLGVALRIAIETAQAADAVSRASGTPHHHINGRHVRVDLRGTVRLDGLLHEAVLRATQDWT